MKIRSVPEKNCIKLCGQTLRFYSFASDSAVSFVQIFENRGKCEKTKELNENTFCVWKRCIKLCGQTLGFYSFASNSAVSFVRIFENFGKCEKTIRKSWQKSRNCEIISLLNRGFARLKGLRKSHLRLWKSGVAIGSLKWVSGVIGKAVRQQ